MDFLLTQAGYVRWWAWGASILLFGGILWLASRLDGQTVWGGAALTPLLALLAVAENGKSWLYGMEELELSCRTPLRAVVLTRVILLGLFHLLLLGALTPVLASWGAVGVLQAGVYLLTPYLLTAGLGLELTRRIRGQEGLLACAASAVLVSALAIVPNLALDLYLPERFFWWLAALGLAAVGAALELKLELKKAEGLQWS